MLTIKSKEATANASKEKVHAFLSDFNNFEKLMPADKVENWKSDGTTCSFTIKGLAGIGMEIAGTTDNSISISSHGKNPFPFKLKVELREEGEKTKGWLEFEGNVNPFLKMMAEKPLTNFFNMLSDALEKEFE